MLSLGELSPQKARQETDLANYLKVPKSLALKQLHAQGLSQRQIAEARGVSRGAVIRHLVAPAPNSTNAPTGQAPAGTSEPNSTNAPTGSGPGASTDPEAFGWPEEPAISKSRSWRAELHSVIDERLQERSDCLRNQVRADL